MIYVLFRNLQRSDLMKRAVLQRVGHIVDKFPYLESHRIVVAVSMENSPRQAGPDYFTVRVTVSGNRMRAVTLQRSALSFPIALAEVSDRLLERMNRHGDRARVRALHQSRDLLFTKRQGGGYEEKSS